MNTAAAVLGRRPDDAVPWLMTLPAVVLAVALSRMLVLVVAAVASEADLTMAMCQWDCGWYLSIMRDGYQVQPSVHAGGEANWAFFPLFPYLARWFAALTSTDVLLSALLINNLAFVVTCGLLHRYFQRLVGSEAAGWGALLFAFWPLSFSFSAPYTESLFLLFVVAGLVMLQDRRFVLAGLCGACASATRNSGFLFIAVYVAYAWGHVGGWRNMLALSNRNLRIVLGFLLIPVGMELYALHLHGVMGDALAFSHVQRAWGREFSDPFTTFLNRGGWRRLFVIVGFAGAWCAWRMGRPGEALFCMLAVLLPISTGRLDSVQRYVCCSLGFAFLLIFVVQRYPKARSFLLAASAVGLTWLAVGWTEAWHGLA